jgi:hypothetical protein
MPDASDRISLPIRVHEFMLSCAGRLDDDALTDARELLAVAEVDRAVELLAVSLVAGRIAVTADDRDRLRDLLGAVRSSPGLVDRIIVDEERANPRHRFTVGVNGDPAAEDGVAEAVSRVVEVLPDIRTMSCVWRTTPAGATSGPVPQRVVLVETGPDGFAPSTAYRVEQALRRAGVRAAVEVLQAGSDMTGYHREALASARRIPLRTAAASKAAPQSLSRPTPPPPSAPSREPSPEPVTEPEDQSFTGPPAPRPVTTTRRRTAAHAEKRETASGRWQQRIAAAEVSQTDPSTTSAPVRDRQPAEPPPAPATQPTPPPMAPVGMSTAAGMAPVQRPQDAPPRPQEPAPAPQTSTVPPAEPEPALAAEAGTAQAPPPSMTSPPPMPSPVPPPMAPPMPPPGPSMPSMSPSMSSSGSDSSGKDAELSQREQELLRQLHEELAKREQAAPQPNANTGSWQVDRSAARPMYNTGTDYASSWQNTQDQTAVNGIPPYGSGPPDRSH